MGRECRGNFGCQYIGDGDWRHTLECRRADERFYERQDMQARITDLEKQNARLLEKLATVIPTVAKVEETWRALGYVAKDQLSAEGLFRDIRLALTHELEGGGGADLQAAKVQKEEPSNA